MDLVNFTSNRPSREKCGDTIRGYKVAEISHRFGSGIRLGLGTVPLVAVRGTARHLGRIKRGFESLKHAGGGFRHRLRSDQLKAGDVKHLRPSVANENSVTVTAYRVEGNDRVQVRVQNRVQSCPSPAPGTIRSRISNLEIWWTRGESNP